MSKLHQLFAFSFLFLLFLMVMGCSEELEPSEESFRAENLSIDTLQVIAYFETHGIAQPKVLSHVKNQGTFIIDNGTKTISLIKEDGELIQTLGGEGRGPGEFMNPVSMQAFSDVFLVLDNAEYRVSRFDYEGNFLNTYPFSTQDLSRAVEFIEDSVYVTGTSTQSDSLLQLVNMKTDTSFIFGVPKEANFTGVDFNQSHNQMQRGEIPDFMKNFIRIQSDGLHIFVYFNSYSELRKYTTDGKLIWNKEIHLPYNEGIIDKTIEESRDRENTSAGIRVFSFIREFEVYENDIYICSPLRLRESPNYWLN